MPHKLLLADDSVTIQRVIELTFADEDVQVLAVGDGKQAMIRAQVEHPDIVLADVGMPERDGYQVAAFIKNTPELSHIPVLLLTGAFEPVDEERAKAAGCDGVLVKPFEPQMVIARVRELLAGRRPAWSASAVPPADGTTPGAARATGTLEDYFDRLDAAFANLEHGPGVTPARPFPPGERAAGPPADRTTPEEEAEHAAAAHFDSESPAMAPEPVETAPVSAAARDGHAAPPAPSVPEPVFVLPSGDRPSLSEVFAALLAAEQQRPVSPSEIAAGALADEVIDDIVSRVVHRMSDRAVRDLVVEVAERLVREEIARIKSGRG